MRPVRIFFLDYANGTGLAPDRYLSPALRLAASFPLRGTAGLSPQIEAPVQHRGRTREVRLADGASSRSCFPSRLKFIS